MAAASSCGCLPCAGGDICTSSAPSGRADDTTQAQLGNVPVAPLGKSRLGQLAHGCGAAGLKGGEQGSLGGHGGPGEGSSSSASRSASAVPSASGTAHSTASALDGCGQYVVGAEELGHHGEQPRR